MTNPHTDALMKSIVQILTEKYGYCGAALGENQALLNSGNDNEIIITIKETPSTQKTNDPASPQKS